ncbi:MAG TPA: polymer-forming cytoskeletal protein [Allosphingosinicella sp.]|nr:polymer-forming cytoskeletal protein [Allosphingosinicella sp.]
MSFIGPEVVISGDVATSAQLHVDGRIDGHVRCAQLCQGASGIVAGDIVAEEARIAGLVQGTVNAATVIVETSGRITGDVSYDTISIAAGAQIDGRLGRREALAQSVAPVLVATAVETERRQPDLDGAELFAAEPKRLAAG